MEVFIIIACSIPLIALAVAGWLGSSRLLAVNRQAILYDQRLVAIDGDTYTFEGNSYVLPGVVGCFLPNERLIGILEGPQNIQPTSMLSERQLQTAYTATATIGDTVALRSEVWLSDPQTAFGLDYEDVHYKTPLGLTPAWLVTGASPHRWTILVHGIESDRNAMLHVLPAIHEIGDTVLIIQYRNDLGAPASPDGYNHLSDTEWQDLDAAVAFSLEHGAAEIRLFGVSLGGSIVQNYLRRGSNTANISKIVLDSPALNWSEILSYRLRQAGYPGILLYPGVYIAWLRSGLSLRRISTRARDITHKTLLIHSADDPSIPQTASRQLAEARPDLVTFADFAHGAHVRSWNYDRTRYEALLRSFLA